MIITITGKPFSGKSEVANFVAQKYGFEVFSGGKIFRQIATERGIDILELNRLADTSIDKLVDDKIVEIGKKKINDNIIFDSRTAWHFIPNSFKVFIDVSGDEQVKRMSNSGRKDEIIDLPREEAIKACNERFNLENERYNTLYGITNTNLSVYDLVVDSTYLTIEQTANKVYEGYCKYLKNLESQK